MLLILLHLIVVNPIGALRALHPGMLPSSVDQVDPWLQHLNQTRLMSTLQPLLQPRPVGSIQHQQVQQWLKQECTQLGFQVELDSFESSEGIQFTNVICTLDPRASRYLSLAAHYDSLRLSTRLLSPSGDSSRRDQEEKTAVVYEKNPEEKDQELFVGAMDSAGSIAILLEVAASLVAFSPTSTTSALPPPFSLQLIFFDGEEALWGEWTSSDSLWGSKHLAERWSHDPSLVPRSPYAPRPIQNRLKQMDLLILLDLLGSPLQPSLKIHATQKRTRHLHEVICTLEQKLMNWQRMSQGHTSRIFQSSDDAEEQEDSVRVEDDHLPFMERGVPILHWIPVPFPPGWHTLDDDVKALDPDVLMDYARLLQLFVQRYLDLRLTGVCQL